MTEPAAWRKLVTRPAPVLLALTAAAGAIRVAVLTSQSIWYDEAFSALRVRVGWVDVVRRTADRDQHPPLYYVLLKAWTSLFGESPAALRSLSLVVGLPMVALLYAIGTRLFDRRTGLVAAGLVTISAFHVYYAQEARMYTLVGTLLAAAVWSFLLVEERPTPLRCAALASSVAAALLTNYGAIFGLLALLAAVPLRPHLDRAARRALLGSLAAGAALFLPWVPTLVQQSRGVADQFWIPFPTPHVVADAVANWVAMNNPTLRNAVLVAAIVLAAIALAVVHDVRTRRETVPSYLFLGVLTVLPPATSLLLSLRTHVFLTRNLFLVATCVVLLAARAFVAGARLLVVAGLAVFVAANLYGVVRIHEAVLKPDWNRAYATVAAGARPGDLLAFSDPSARVSFAYHLRTRPSGRLERLAETALWSGTATGNGASRATAANPAASGPVGSAARVWTIGRVPRQGLPGYRRVRGVGGPFLGAEVALFERNR